MNIQQFIEEQVNKFKEDYEKVTGLPLKRFTHQKYFSDRFRTVLTDAIEEGRRQAIEETGKEIGVIREYYKTIVIPVNGLNLMTVVNEVLDNALAALSALEKK